MILVEVRKEAIDEVYEQLPPGFRSLVTSELHIGITFPEVLAKLNAYWSGIKGGFLRGLIDLNSRGLSKLNSATIFCMLLAYLHLASAIYDDDDIATINTFRMILLNSAFLFDHVSHYEMNESLELDSSRMAHSNLNGAWEVINDWPIACIRWMSQYAIFDLFDVYTPVIWREKKDDPVESVWFCDHNKLVRLSLERDQSLRSALATFADSKETQVKSFRYSILRSSKPLYVSEIGRKTTKDVGLVDGDIIMCELIKQCPSPTVAREPIPEAKPNRKKGKSKKKTKQRMKRRSVHPTQYQPAKDEGSYRVEHSKKLSLVFEEADATLKAIRQKLNDLQLKRTPAKSAAALPGAKVDRIITPTGLRPGKAGNVYYDVKVGEVSSLYKTTNPSRRNKFDSAASITIDLHGCTREEGKAKLDSCLPVWIQSAMEGSYPWVTRVRIVCGGGSQILSEMVEGWIKEHETVANSISS